MRKIDRVLLKILVAAVLLTVLSGCMSLPEEARSYILDFLSSSCEDGGRICEDYRVTAERREISSAEEKNGITDKWCVRVDYVFRYADDSEYHDTYWGERLLVQRDGHWDAGEYCWIP